MAVREDYPAEMERRRKQLLPILRAAKMIKKYKGKCKLVRDKLVVDKKVYTVEPDDNLNELPDELNPVKVSQKVDDTCLVFFGQHHPLSNFYKCQLKIDNVKYNCTEQYIQSEKCKLFDDDRAHYKVMNSHNPYDMKSTGSRVKNYDALKWAAECQRVATNAIRSKFTQNPKLKTVLLDTVGKTLGEASRDKFWGTGGSKWLGQRMHGLGRTYMVCC